MTASKSSRGSGSSPIGGSIPPAADQPAADQPAADQPAPEHGRPAGSEASSPEAVEPSGNAAEQLLRFHRHAHEKFLVRGTFEAEDVLLQFAHLREEQSPTAARQFIRSHFLRELMGEMGVKIRLRKALAV